MFDFDEVKKVPVKLTEMKNAYLTSGREPHLDFTEEGEIVVIFFRAGVRYMGHVTSGFKEIDD
jgi:hypothetical protein